MQDNLNNENILSNLPLSQITAGFLMGLSVGYFLKKSFKLLLFFMGLATVIVFWYNSQHHIEVNGNSILNFFDILLNGLKSTYSFVYTKLTSLEPIGGASIIAGFMLGLKIG